VTRLVALALLTVACGAPQPPRYYSIDSSFTEAQREVIRAAVDAWCVATGDCAEEALWVDRGRILLVDSVVSPGTCEGLPECVVGGRNTGDGRVLIARDRPSPDSLDLLWTIAAHEWGHFCAEHTQHGLMAAIQHADAPVLTVDEDAVRAWREGCVE
jgi:hypothetical protein